MCAFVYASQTRARVLLLLPFVCLALPLVLINRKIRKEYALKLQVPVSMKEEEVGDVMS